MLRVVSVFLLGGVRRFEDEVRRRARARLVSLALVGLSSVVARADAPPPVRDLPLHFSAPPGCIDEATFRSHLLALHASAAAIAPPREVTVAITQEDGVFTGDVRVVYADGTSTSRTVGAARCDEVSDALGFVTALALGLDYAPQIPPPKPAEPPPPVAAPVPPPLRGSTWRFSAGARVAVLSAVGPNVEVAPALVFGVELDRAGLLAPSFELSGTGTTSGTIPTVAGEGTLALAGGAVAACPIRLRIGGGLSLRPCLEMGAGAFIGTSHASASQAVPEVIGSTEARPFLALLPLGRVEWKLARHFVVTADGGPDIPLLHADFYFSPSNIQLYDVKNVGATGRLGVFFVWP
jgi:hypothetical protein